jgi:hypothetical protein
MKRPTIAIIRKGNRTTGIYLRFKNLDLRLLADNDSVF